jgi:hypothetical protein
MNGHRTFTLEQVDLNRKPTGGHPLPVQAWCSPADTHVCTDRQQNMHICR